MIVLRKGMNSVDVGKWQTFLRGMKCYYGIIDNDFSSLTEEATKKFQFIYQLEPDGTVGRMTYAKAISLGFGTIQDDDNSINSVNFPLQPADVQPLRGVQKEQLFGKIEYVADPIPTNKEKIKITNSYYSDNIIMVDNPYLAKATNNVYTKMLFHKDLKYQLLQMFREWDEAGLLDRIKSYGGSFIARFIRGSKTNLSNHAYGSAFDINMLFNPLGATPALVGKPGCVRELVAIANKWGFFWGGWFSRKDGMHFEAFKIIKP